MLNRIPTEADWDNWKNDPPIDKVDEWNRKHAKEKFLGKSKEEIFTIFQENFMSCSDDFYSMPRICFRYYIFMLAQYLDQPIKVGIDCSDAASCFLSFIEHRTKNDPETIMPIFCELLIYMNKIAENQSMYAAPVEIYGDFKIRVEEIKNLAEKAKIRF